MSERIRTTDLTLGYGDRTVVSGLDLAIPDGALTAVIGANACGKSTLLRALVRLLPAKSGAVLVDDRAIEQWRTKSLARELGFLPQQLVAPESVRVRQLVARGRFPHQGVLGAWSPSDDDAVQQAMGDAGVQDLADRLVDSLSGGQRQRVWLAMVLAQETSVLLLDEPTTFLDIAHQYELLRLLTRLRSRGRTVVAVLHDVNQACRYADHVIAMKDGAVVAAGAPSQVVDAELVRDVFGLDCVVVPDPVTGAPLVVPTEPSDG